LVGANVSSKAEGLDLLPGKSNYFLTSDPQTWFTKIPNYTRVQYKNLYPGIDLVYYGNQRQLEYDFVVAPGANPNAIDLQLLGAKEEHVSADGSLVAQIDGGEVFFQKPMVYQRNERGEKEYLNGSYVLEASSNPPQVHFQVSPYDFRRELVIDPVLVYSTYLGGEGEDEAVRERLRSSDGALSPPSISIDAQERRAMLPLTHARAANH